VGAAVAIGVLVANLCVAREPLGLIIVGVAVQQAVRERDGPVG
jgi:hypothetical protein